MNAALTEPKHPDTALRTRAPAGDSPDRPANTPQPHARILYAEDDASTRYSVKLMLGRAGYTVDAAADGAEAWSALQGKAYDLLITDNQMPHLKGVDLIRRVRRAKLELPIILASSNASELPWTNCDALLPKPFTVEELLSVVSGVLRARPKEARHLCQPTPWNAGSSILRHHGLAAPC